jgi:subtilisin family serine protease
MKNILLVLLLATSFALHAEQVDPCSKISPGLSEVLSNLTLDVRIALGISFYEALKVKDIESILTKYKAVMIDRREIVRGPSVEVRLLASQIDVLMYDKYIKDIDVVSEIGILNFEVGIAQKTNVLCSALPGGYSLSGNGVTVGVGDGGELGDHIDFGHRVINMANGTYSSYGDHGDHVSGIIAGCGNLSPRHKGIAPECTIVSEKTSLITHRTEQYFNDHEMVLTNNSYGTSYNCATNGSYSYSSRTLDWQLREYPKVLHVFAAGNSGRGTCDPYPTGYCSVLRNYQSAKNVLTVGMAEENRVIAVSSSRGPVLDGRLKPEIIGIGRNVISTSRDYNYSTKGGTSMSSPGVVGTLALLVEKYRLENDGENPDGALLKAVACNTADDLGNPGPDFIHGFGLINGRRAAQVIEDSQFFSDSLQDGEAVTFSINVLPNTNELKVMLYWHDKEASVYPDKALVNNLDLEVHDLTGVTYHPWVLDPSPTGVHLPAVRKKDTLNNIEQVTIQNPLPGTHYLRVSGPEIPFGRQKFFIVYESIMKNGLQITYPAGGEKTDPTDPIIVSWDGNMTTTDSVIVGFSLEGGDFFEEMGRFAIHESIMTFSVSDTVTTNQAIIRLSDLDGNVISQSLAFTIMPRACIVSSADNEIFWADVGDFYRVEILDIPSWEYVVFADSVYDTNISVPYSTDGADNGWTRVTAYTNEGVVSLPSDAVRIMQDPALLPVQMISFDGYKDEKVNRLEWKIAGSGDSREFVIQRSCDGEDWFRLGGLTIYATRYRYCFIDNVPDRISYYRLKIIDHNESYEYSETRVLERKPTVMVTLYPNPTYGTVNIISDSQIDYLHVFDNRGQRVSYRGGVGDRIIYLENIPNGDYHVEMGIGREVICQKIIII